jgi:peptidyl-Lys metalloendopeptidase
MKRIQWPSLFFGAVFLAGCGAPGEPTPPPTQAQPDAPAASPVAQASAGGLEGRLDVVKAQVGQDDDVEVKWSLTNHGSVTAYVPKWQAPSTTLSSNLFDIRVGETLVPYSGKVIKRPAATAADMIAIAPGETLSSTVNLSSFYKLGRAGQYQIQYAANPDEAVAASVPESDGIRSNAVVAERTVDSRYAAAEQESLLPEIQPFSLGYRNCSSSRKTLISQALTGAQNYARNAESYLNSGKAGARYTTWFGTNNSSRYSTVKSHYTKIRSTTESAAITVDCGCTDDYYAYVYPDQPYIVYVCNAFWSAPVTGTDSKAGTLIHELSHFNVVAGTNDWTYGQSSCKSLAKSNPSRAIDNADSHEYFAENNPSQN